MKLNFVHKWRGLSIFILFAAMVTLLAGGAYGAAQQVYRMNANDPQIEATEAIAEALNQGAPAEAIIGQGSDVDVSKSLSLFIIIFDKDGKVAASSAKLNGSSPTPPSGVFDYLKKHNDERFTWQPQKGVRLAAVMKKADGDKGFVLVGRSLREVEKRVDNLGIMIGIAWIASLLVSAALAWLLSRTFTGVTIVEETVVVEAPNEEVVS